MASFLPAPLKNIPAPWKRGATAIIFWLVVLYLGVVAAPAAAGYLSKKVPLEVSSGKVTVTPEIILHAGDLNNDGIINLLDLGILSGAYGSRQGAGSFAGAADVNKDGCVDLADPGWLASNYGAVGD